MKTVLCHLKIWHPLFPGEGDVFLLLPLTLSSDRRFALLKGGGEFTQDVDKALGFGKCT